MSAVESCLSRSPRFKLLLSIFILQSFLTLAGLVMTESTVSSDPSSKTYSNSSITAQVSVCPPVTSSLDPWACDLIRAQRLLGQESSSSSSRCKPSSSANNLIEIIQPPSQCLLLTPNRTTHICKDRSMDRKRLDLSSYTLPFCHKFSLPILTDGSWMSVNTSQCQSLIETLITDLNRRDKIAREVSCHFDALIARYNCQTGYSVQWGCEECSVSSLENSFSCVTCFVFQAVFSSGITISFLFSIQLFLPQNTYRDWICATLLPVFDEGSLRKPCGSFCKRVEQRCPYLHPSHKEQYAGEPAFICIGKDIVLCHARFCHYSFLYLLLSSAQQILTSHLFHL